MPRPEAPFEAIRMILNKVDELIRSILFAGMTFTIAAEEF